MIEGLFEGRRWNALIEAFPEYYIPGFLMTLKISLVGLLVALILGLMFGMFSTSKWRPFLILSRIYVEFIQNTPLALQIMFYYMVLPMAFSSTGYRILEFMLGIIGAGICHGAYVSEVIRTGIEAVPKGQAEAAVFQGFFYLQTMRFVIPPQTIRIIVPPLANQVLNLVKNTSILATVIGMDLIYFTDSQEADRRFFTQAYLTSALMFFVIYFPLARLARYLEIRSTQLPVSKQIELQMEEEVSC